MDEVNNYQSRAEKLSRNVSLYVTGAILGAIAAWILNIAATAEDANFILIRFIICGVALGSAYIFYRAGEGKNLDLIIPLIIAFTFNPIILATFEEPTWVRIDIACMLYFSIQILYCLYFARTSFINQKVEVIRDRNYRWSHLVKKLNNIKTGNGNDESKFKRATNLIEKKYYDREMSYEDAKYFLEQLELQYGRFAPIVLADNSFVF